MKNLMAMLVIVSIVLTQADACSQAVSTANASDGKISVVCTIFPQYDWVRNLIKGQEDRFELTLLQTSAVDLHSFQPTVEDIVKISDCDLFIYVGGESDEWVENALSEARNQDLVVVNLLEQLGDSAVTEELVEGMEEEEDHVHAEGEEHAEEDHDHEEGEEHTEEEHDHEEGEEHAEDEHDHEEGEEHAEEEHTHEGEAVLDEHVWLSISNARGLSLSIADALSLVDEENSSTYLENQQEYSTTQLLPLETAYKQALADVKYDTLLFGDRFPFRYLVDECGLDYYAAFPGCSADTEASFDTIIFLAQKADELQLDTVMVTESSDKTIAQTIIDNTQNGGQQILALNSMQSVSTADVDNVTYVSIMQENLEVLKEALI
jgi:zinc transport system substrate-binding protein